MTVTQKRYICVHGHFYQPPRENPWLEEIEQQDSAHPYHDWNARICAEAYAPNTRSRILDRDEWIVRIINNYRRISFNVGPTLLQWLERSDPDTYDAIIAADRASRDQFGGHGSALAQVYNHMIMPLANQRDRETQVRWGVADFRHRFGRDPEGIWLPETAVDVPTLEVLAVEGLAFTILAPSQAARVRQLPDGDWQDVSGGRVDPTRGYVCRLPSGRDINLFFYDGPIAHAISFEGLLASGEALVNRLMGGFGRRTDGVRLVNVATDGEVYGHHHRHGDMALAYALEQIHARDDVALTNYGQFLERHPPNWEVEIQPNTAWSCAHGVERWRSDCGCQAGRGENWHQRWRGPLRAALDWLRDEIAPHYESRASDLLGDPWGARDGYVSVILDRTRDTVDAFLSQQAGRELSDSEIVEALKLLELQRHAMLMYTSCGWFFDEISGIETVQVLEYAGRAVQLAEELFHAEFEGPFLERLAQAESNRPRYGDGRGVFEQRVRPSVVDLPEVGAHYAMSSRFEDYEDRERLFCYTVDRHAATQHRSGRAVLTAGRIAVTSNVTLDRAELDYGLLHLGDHNIECGVRQSQGAAAYLGTAEALRDRFARGDVFEVARLLRDAFEGETYSLRSLFRDEQRKAVAAVLAPALESVEREYEQIYTDHVATMRFIGDLGVPLPAPYRTTAEHVLNSALRDRLASSDPAVEPVVEILEEVRVEGVELAEAEHAYTFGRTVSAIVDDVRAAPEALESLRRLDTAVEVALRLPFEVDLWRAQNVCYRLSRQRLPKLRERAEAGDASAQAWVSELLELAEKLRIRVDD